MKQNSFAKKRIMHIYVVILILIVILLTAVFLMIKYSVEGEKNLPFEIKNISIISSAESDITQDDEENWHAGILQKNDILFVIEKNKNYKKEDTIKEIKIENFEIKKSNENMEINLYRPQSNAFGYTYSDDYKIQDLLKYEGALETKIEDLKINNQGCKIGMSIASENLGEYKFSVNEKVPSDGKLLAKAGLEKKDIEFSISFDIVIETGLGNKFKARISFDLPIGNILEEGVSTQEITNLQDIVFKRV